MAVDDGLHGLRERGDGERAVELDRAGAAGLVGEGRPECARRGGEGSGDGVGLGLGFLLRLLLGLMGLGFGLRLRLGFRGGFGLRLCDGLGGRFRLGSGSG